MEIINVSPSRPSKDPRVPRVFLRSKELTPAHKLVIIEMLARQGTANFFKASYQQIANEVGLSRRHVMRIIEDLKNRREVNITKHGHLEILSFSLRFANNRNRRAREYRASQESTYEQAC